MKWVSEQRITYTHSTGIDSMHMRYSFGRFYRESSLLGPLIIFSVAKIE